jgi:anthranilate phosphoribosyltransferase
MKQILSRLINHEELTREETRQIIFDITQGKFSDPQIAALLMGIQMRGITVDELIGLRDGILETGVPVDLSPYHPLDIVGTGGDQKNTFNISTCSCFVVAGAGYKVAKHGNYAATSVSGASNVIEGHGVKFTADNEKLKYSLETCNFVYLHAQLFAKAMKFVGPVRKALGVPTCFNLLGPLVNPCRPTYQLLGVANLAQMRLYSNVYQRLGTHYGIVNSIDGYDEISLTGDFKGVTSSSERILNPRNLGLEVTRSEDLYGGESKEDALRIFDNVLRGEGTESQKNVVLANAAYGIQILRPELAIEDCVGEARESLESGKAYGVLKKYVEINS